MQERNLCSQGIPLSVSCLQLALNWFSGAFSITWPASMQIYWNKRKRLHKKRVQLPQDCFGTPWWLGNDDGDGSENGKKATGLDKQNNTELRTCSVLFSTFVCHRCLNRTWKYQLLSFVEDGNTRKRDSSFPEFWYSPLEFNSRQMPWNSPTFRELNEME